MKFWDNMLFHLFGMKKYEDKLRVYEGYNQNSIISWKRKTGFSWKLLKKLLSILTIYSTKDIRNMLIDQYNANKALFDSEHTYFTSFGEEGKSGSIIIYQLRHSNIQDIDKRIISSWEIGSLPSESKIVFVDDLVGTGKQSTDYINKKLCLLLNPSCVCYLWPLCGTSQGIKKVEDETIFYVIKGIVFDEESCDYLGESSTAFSETEKRTLIEKNEMLAGKSSQYDLGLLLAFSHCVPNNTMPIIWKEGYKYTVGSENKEWMAILPRKY